MGKTSKVTGTETKAGKLREMRRLGLTDAKTFSKGAAAVWADYSKAFPKGTPKNATFIKASADARKACASVNMQIIGNVVVFPTGPGGTAKIRETKRGVFIDYGRAGKKFKDFHDTVILSKDGNHIKYGMELAKRNQRREGDTDEISASYGTLKTHAYKSGGEMFNGFMRDTARAYENPLNALLDDRYAQDKDSIEATEIRLDKGFVDRLQQKNGVAALIRVRM